MFTVMVYCDVIFSVVFASSCRGLVAIGTSLVSFSCHILFTISNLSICENSLSSPQSMEIELCEWTHFTVMQQDLTSFSHRDYNVHLTCNTNLYAYSIPWPDAQQFSKYERLPHFLLLNAIWKCSTTEHTHQHAVKTEMQNRSSTISESGEYRMLWKALLAGWSRDQTEQVFSSTPCSSRSFPLLHRNVPNRQE